MAGAGHPLVHSLVFTSFVRGIITLQSVSLVDCVVMVRYCMFLPRRTLKGELIQCNCSPGLDKLYTRWGVNALSAATKWDYSGVPTFVSACKTLAKHWTKRHRRRHWPVTGTTQTGCVTCVPISLQKDRDVRNTQCKLRRRMTAQWTFLTDVHICHSAAVLI